MITGRDNQHAITGGAIYTGISGLLTLGENPNRFCLRKRLKFQRIAAFIGCRVLFNTILA